MRYRCGLVTHCILGGLPLFLLGDECYCLFQSAVRFAVSQKGRHDFLVGYATYEIVLDYLFTIVKNVVTAGLTARSGIPAQRCLASQAGEECPYTSS